MLPDSVLRMASENRWKRVFRSIVANGYNVNGTFDERQESLLHMAAKQGNTAAGKQLLQMGANPHARDKSGWSPIHGAAWCGHADFCAVLPPMCIAQVTGNIGHTPLYLACRALNSAETKEKEAQRCRLICWLLEQPERDPDFKDTHAYATWNRYLLTGLTYMDQNNIIAVDAAFEWAKKGTTALDAGACCVDNCVLRVVVESVWVFCNKTTGFIFFPKPQ